MTDNEIIKALEHCPKCVYGSCPECPMYEVDGCDNELMRYALDLIKRQQAEIERVKTEKNDVIERQQAENDRLRKNCGDLYAELCWRLETETRIARKLAIKEFAERLKEELTTGAAVMRVSTLDVIDNLVKEMTEEATK